MRFLSAIASSCLAGTAIGLVACGSSAPLTSPVDAHAVDAGEDVIFASPLEAGFDTGLHFDVGKPSPVAPVGKALVRVADAQLAGVTDDGYVAYIDGTGAVFAIPVTGGDPTLIVSDIGGTVSTGDAAEPDADIGVERFSEVVVSHAFIAAWTSTVSSLAPSPLIVWSAKLGAPKAIASSSMPGVFAASADSSFFTYVDPVSGGSASATLYGVLGDGGGKKALLTPIVLSNAEGNCFPKQVLAGPYLVEAYCLAQAFGGAGSTPSVVSFDSANDWAQATLVASAIDQVAVDPAGQNVLAATSAGALEYIPIGGGPPVAIDEGNPVSTTPTSSDTLFLAASPARAVYRTASGALRVAPLAGGAAATLATGSVGTVFGLSPNGAYVSYAASVQDSVSGYPINFSIVSTTPGSAPVSLDRGNPGVVFSNLYDPDTFNGTEFTTGLVYAFTADSAFALLSTVPAGTFDDTPPGSLQAFPVTGGFKVTTAASVGVYTAVPLTGSRVLWNDGYKASGNVVGGPIADLRVADLATNVPTLILAGADANFVVSPDKGTVVYALNYGTSDDGVYAVAIP